MGLKTEHKTEGDKCITCGLQEHELKNELSMLSQLGRRLGDEYKSAFYYENIDKRYDALVHAHPDWMLESPDTSDE